MSEMSAGAVIFRRDNGTIRYLVLLYGAGHWDFVKGHVEKDEDTMETVTREAEEETGLIDLKFISGFSERISYSYTKNNRSIAKEVVFLLAETKTTDIRLSFEHKAHEWLAFDKALKKATFETAKKVLKKADKAVRSYVKQENS